MKWYYWLGGLLILALGAWFFFDERKKEKEKMARVREAKAAKNFQPTTLNTTNDGTVQYEAEVKPEGN